MCARYGPARSHAVDGYRDGNANVVVALAKDDSVVEIVEMGNSNPAALSALFKTYPSEDLPGLRAKRNEIVHPLVREWMQAAERAAVQAAGPPGPIIVHDVPLLAESRGKAGFDVVIVVDVPPELQVERLVHLRGMAPDRARARMAAQASREQRLAVADIVIDNSGSLDDLDRRVAEVWVNLERRMQT